MGWQAGNRVGDYEVIGTLGNGGMGEVYKVRHVISDRVEAMKVLLSGSSQGGELANRFLREIRVLAKLSHPHIAGLHTAFQHEDQLMMIMEFVEGRTLTDAMRRGLTLDQSVELARQILSALQYAHAHGVIHRDIKPSNVMVNQDGAAKLLDFGLALASTPDARLTSPNSLMGSVHYISPEHIRGVEVDARSDLYAFGVVLYELTTGKMPIEGKGVPEIIHGHLTVVPKSPKELNPSIPDVLAAAILQSLKKDPAERQQSAAELLGQLQGLSGISRDMDETLHGSMVRTQAELVRTNTPPSGSQGANSSAKSFGTAVLDDISLQLATYIGPIAKVVVKRASSGSNNLRELCDKVALEIDSEKSRNNFLASVRKHLRASGEL
jgi:eukaryotic-like serine/threonine-protein kinase